MVEEAAGDAVAEVDDGRGKGEGYDGDEGFEGDEDNRQSQGEVLADVEAREKGDV